MRHIFFSIHKDKTGQCTETLWPFWTTWYNMPDNLVQTWKQTNNALSFISIFRVTTLQCTDTFWTIWYNMSDILVQTWRCMNNALSLFSIYRQSYNSTMYRHFVTFLDIMVQYARHFGTDMKMYEQRLIIFFHYIDKVITRQRIYTLCIFWTIWYNMPDILVHTWNGKNNEHWVLFFSI